MLVENSSNSQSESVADYFFKMIHEDDKKYESQMKIVNTIVYISACVVGVCVLGLIYLMAK